MKSNQTAHAHTTELQLRACVCGGIAHEKNSGYLPKNIGAFHESYNFGVF